MSNHFFSFKQFTIHQEHCAMKVCTDACLFGSILAKEINADEFEIKHALDIGAGTGLLSLMYAQKNEDVCIDSVEIDENAAVQAQKNIEVSPWATQVNLLKGDIQEIVLPQEKYDFIFSNPPFFENDLKSPDHKRNLALHSHQLTLAGLFDVMIKYLNPHGVFAVLLPYHRTWEVETLCKEKGLSVFNKITVRQTAKHTAFRSILFISRELKESQTSEIIIRDEVGNYTLLFEQLLKDYYLKL